MLIQGSLETLQSSFTLITRYTLSLGLLRRWKRHLRGELCIEGRMSKRREGFYRQKNRQGGRGLNVKTNGSECELTKCECDEIAVVRILSGGNFYELF